MKWLTRLSVVAFCVAIGAGAVAAPKAKRGYTKFLVHHGPNPSAPDQLLVGIAGEVVHRYESYTVVQMEQKAVEAFTKRAGLQAVEIQKADHFDRMYLPNVVTDARDGARGPHPVRSLAAGQKNGRNGLYVVQFVGPILPEWQEAVVAAGAKVFNYVPFNSLLVTANEAQAATVAALPYVQYFDAFQSGMKDQRPPRKAGEARHYIVHLADVPGVEEDLRAIANLGSSVGEPRRGVANELRVEVRLDGARADQVLELPLVVGLSAPIQVQMSDERVAAATGGLIMPISGEPRNTPHYKDWLSSACSYCTNLNAEGFKVGLADTGLHGGFGLGATHHPDLPSSRLSWGSNYMPSTSPYYSLTLADRYGHGSAVAGVIAGDPSTSGQKDAGGFFYGTGIAPSVGLFVTGISVHTPDLVLDDIVGDAAAHEVWVQNHSYNRYTSAADRGDCANFYDGIYDSMSQDMDKAVIDHGVTVTVSAGNRNQQPAWRPADCMFYENLTLPPAMAKNVIAVGGAESVRDLAFNCHDSESTDFCDIMENSKRGTQYPAYAAFSAKWYIKPDLFAPAAGIAVHQDQYFSSPLNFCTSSGSGSTYALGTGNLYLASTGTSFAAPVGAGAAILASRRYAETVKGSGAPDPAAAKPSLIKAMLIAGAKSMFRAMTDRGVDKPTGQDIEPLPNSIQGFGRLSLDQVLSEYPARVYINESASLSSVSGTWSHTYKIHDPSLPVKVVIAWTDPAGAPSSTLVTPLVNDLDLFVETGSPCTNRRLGNDMGWNSDPAEEYSFVFDCTEPAADHANNVEMVKFYPPAGLTEFTVKVRATTGSMTTTDPQEFSAVVYNAGEVSATLPPLTPASLTATAAYSGSWSVNLTWPSVSGATSYEVHVSTGGTFSSAGTPTTNSFTHTGRSASTTYLYKVRAVNASGKSGFTPIDPATTVAFTDGDLIGATIKVAHINELRTAANAFRAAAGMAAYSFTDPTLTAGSSLVKPVHIIELRAAIESARDALGLPWTGYTSDPSTGAPIYRVHITSLRELVK